MPHPAERGRKRRNNAGATGVVGFAPAPPAPTAATEALAKAQEALAQAQAAVTAAQAAARGNDGGFPAGRGGGRGGATPIPSDLTTVQNVQLPVTPNFTGDEAFFEFLLSASPTKFADLKAMAEQRRRHGAVRDQCQGDCAASTTPSRWSASNWRTTSSA